MEIFYYFGEGGLSLCIYIDGIETLVFEFVMVIEYRIIDVSGVLLFIFFADLGEVVPPSARMDESRMSIIDEIDCKEKK